MNIDELRSLSAKTELSLNFVAKDEMISHALLSLQGNDDIILKGGTAVNRVYLRNKRFSEDIDFDLIFGDSAKRALKRTSEIAGKIKGLERPRIMKETIRYDLLYANPLGHKDRIRIEFRVAKKAKNYGKKVVNFGFVPAESALLNVYNIEELIKQKTSCILNRLEGKDFFDLYYLIDIPHGKIVFDKEKILERISLAESMLKDIANAANHYIPKSQRPSWEIFLEELRAKILKI